MKFNEYPYQRPDFEAIKIEIEQLSQDLKNADSVDQALETAQTFYNLLDEIDSMMQLVFIRHSIDTKDPFYEAEQNFVNDALPVLESSTVKFSKDLLDSKYRDTLEEKLGSLLFKKAEIAQKVFSDEIIPELQLENKLTNEYMKLRSSALIDFEGKMYTLTQMTPFSTHKDRNLRKHATLAVSNWFKENSEAFEQIYDELITVRSQMAKKLGYDSFIEMGYDRLNRLDYNAKDVAAYRKQVHEHIIPYVENLIKRKQHRLQIADMKSYDLNLNFLSGNPLPKGDRSWQVQQAISMYDQMSPETSKFFRYMVDKELLDLDSKQGKEGGGYCTYIPKFESPFIFANFNGTSGDVDVLTHEAGHAFQVYMSRNLLRDYRWPSYEAAEIHSMSMEFLAWPYIDLFFKEDTDKYKFSHLSSGIEFLPYGVLVDHFQHEVYRNPELSKDERKAVWQRLEKMYLPWKVYDDNDYMNSGTWWFRQGHIFQDPFYYIDYTLAQVVAFDFWGKNKKDPKTAWQQYLELCKMGGQYSFVELLEKAKLPNPFKEGTIQKILEPIKTYLDQVDDKKF